jgi:hypothetical protein
MPPTQDSYHSGSATQNAATQISEMTASGLVTNQAYCKERRGAAGRLVIAIPHRQRARRWQWRRQSGPDHVDES